MPQLSLFSADLTPPVFQDLGGLLAGHAQLARSSSGTRLSVLLEDSWRARCLVRELQVRDVPAEPPIRTVDGEVLLRSSRRPELDVLAESWTKGAVKAVPSILVMGPGWLRCWVLAAGRPDQQGYWLGLDPRAPDTHEPLAAGMARAGMAAVLVGARGAAPGLRVIGHRRVTRLAELVRTPPPEAPRGAFPGLTH